MLAGAAWRAGAYVAAAHPELQHSLKTAPWCQRQVRDAAESYSCNANPMVIAWTGHHHVVT